jgi:hypothetical protein
LEKLKKIIEAADSDEQTANSIRYGIEGCCFLYKENIGYTKQ